MRGGLIEGASSLQLRACVGQKSRRLLPAPSAACTVVSKYATSSFGGRRLSAFPPLRGLSPNSSIPLPDYSLLVARMQRSGSSASGLERCAKQAKGPGFHCISSGLRWLAMPILASTHRGARVKTVHSVACDVFLECRLICGLEIVPFIEPRYESKESCATRFLEPRP